MNLRTAPYNAHEETERVLKDFEEKWAPELSKVSLVAELSVPATEIENLVGSVRWLNAHHHQRLLKGMHNVPACVLAIVTSTAVDVYEGGTFWRHFFARIGGRGSQVEQAVWGDNFLRALDTFELPKFASRSHRYIAPILAHAGIPTYCLGDYFAAVDQAMRTVGANADEVASWALPRVDTALANIDVPVRRFLARGDQYAVEYIDRSMDLLIRLNRDDDPTPALMPDRVVEAAREHLERLHRRGARSGAARDAVRDSRAALTLDPAEGDLFITLPAMDAVDEDLTWCVQVDDITEYVTPAKRMGGRSIGIREATFPLRKPARAVSVAARGLDRAQHIDVVDPRDPVLFFSDTGQPLPPHLPLPGGQLWALYALPQDDEPAFSDRIVHYGPAPLGWSGWRLCLLDLKGAHSVQLSATHGRHPVRNDARATLESVSSTPHVRSHGEPVHSARPQIHLPDGIDAAWNLTVVDVASGKTICEREIWSSERDHDQADPFDGVKGPVVGRYSISVRGPLGKGLSRIVSVAEGLNADCSVPLRKFEPAGLTSCTVGLSGAGLDIAHRQLRFDERAAEKSTLIAGPSGELEVLVTPPAMAVALEKRGVPDRWLHSAAACSTEDVADYRLHLRLPGEAHTEVHVVNTSGTILQSLRATTGEANQGRGHVAVFDLSEASETVAKAGTATLEIGNDPRIRLVKITPKRLAHGAVAASDRVIVLKEAATGPVRARVWSLWEPWEGPWDTDVSDDRAIVLPDELVGRGSVGIHLHVEDPWVPSAAPAFPDRSTDLFVTVLPDPSGLDSTLALAGLGEAAAPLTFAQSWSLLAMRAHTPRFHYPDDVLEALTASLRSRPTEALIALSKRSSAIDENIQLLVSSGLLWTQVEEPDALRALGLEDNHLASAVMRTPAVGTLLAGRHLASASSPRDFPATWTAILTSVGEPFRSVLTGNGDPAAQVGKLEQTHLLDTLPHAHYEALTAALDVVPSALLDSDSRVAGAMELFDHRRQHSIKETSREAHALTSVVVDRLTDIGAVVLAEAVQERQVDERREIRVAQVSALSLALACLARLASRGEPTATTSMRAVRRFLDTLSRSAPRLLAVDVALAEAHVCALLATEHPTFTSIEEPS